MKLKRFIETDFIYTDGSLLNEKAASAPMMIKGITVKFEILTWNYYW